MKIAIDENVSCGLVERLRMMGYDVMKYHSVPVLADKLLGILADVVLD